MIRIICEPGVVAYQGTRGTLKVRSIMSLWSWKAGLAGVAIVAATAYAMAQMPSHSGMHDQMSPAGTDQQQMMSQSGMQGDVTSADAKQVTKLKGLGFMGIMVQGAHHQPHHLAMAKGEFMH